MRDVHFPTTDGHTLVFTRYAQPEKDRQLLLHQLKLCLPPQSPPKQTFLGRPTNTCLESFVFAK
jgi:hypothetical protein